MKSVVIVGGGLAGLSAALQLNKYGFDVTIIEKKVFPFIRVCGEIFPGFSGSQFQFFYLLPIL